MFCSMVAAYAFSLSSREVIMLAISFALFSPQFEKFAMKMIEIENIV